MNRWSRVLLAGTVFISTAALAQGFVREAPRDVKPAVIAVSATPPIITVNDQADRLSPGARIRDRNNMLVLSGGLAGKTLYTVYRRDSAGLVHEVWLLSPEEYTKLGGTSGSGDSKGIERFNELLALIFGARAAVHAR